MDELNEKFKASEEGQEKAILKEFVEKFDSNRSYVPSHEIFCSLWDKIMSILSEDSNSNEVYCYGLKCVKILSRFKDSLNKHLKEHHISRILYFAGLENQECAGSFDHETISISQKCLLNMMINNNFILEICFKNSFMPAVTARIAMDEIPLEIKVYDLKLIFLLSAKYMSSRSVLRTKYTLSESLSIILKRIIDNSNVTDGNRVLNLNDKEICFECLRILYNIYHSIDRSNVNENDKRNCEVLIPLLRTLLCSSLPQDYTEELRSHCINVLLIMPPSLYDYLIPPATPSSKKVYGGKDMTAISNTLELTKNRLMIPENHTVEKLLPPLSFLGVMVSANATIRKYSRKRVLTPIRNPYLRPEEGSAMRNKLCSLMTSPIPELKSTSSELLFTLCKENVGRFVKYTGYGNAAGLLAQRGLMLGGQANGEYSSDDSESDDDELYEQLQDQINPITGRVEPNHPPPFEGMTEEQKEYETMKLVEALDKLNRQNIIQPCIIGEDGKPRPIKHVSELLEDKGTFSKGDGSGKKSESD